MQLLHLIARGMERERERGRGASPKNDLLHTKLHATLHVLFYVGAATWANVVAFAAHFHNIRQHMLAITYATGGHCIGLANGVRVRAWVQVLAPTPTLVLALAWTIIA